MKRIAFCLLMSLTLLFSTSCRKNLMDLNNSMDGSLSVSVAVNRSLYQGEYLQDSSGRFVGPTNESISLSYVVGEQEYTTTLELELNTDGENLTGTATLTGLPVGVEGVVNVSTFNAAGEILCDGEETLVLASGENQTTITLSISESCPYLEIGNPAEYINGLIQPGAVYYLELPDLVAGAEYEMYIYQEVESPEPPLMSVITTSGVILDSQEIQGSDYGVLSFTLPSDSTGAVVCFYNPHDYSVPGLIWIDRLNEFTSVTFSTQEGDLDSNAKYWRVVGGYDKLLSTDQQASSDVADLGGLRESSDGGSIWTLHSLISKSIGTDTSFPARVADIDYINGLVYCLIDQRLTSSTSPPFDDIGVAVYNAADGSAANQYTQWQNTNTEHNSPIENYRIAVSGSTIFIAYLTAANNLELLAGSGPDSPDKGTLSVPGFTSNPTIIDELQVCALEDDLYIYADKNVYRWTAGSGALDLVFSLDNGTTEYFRYLSVYRNKYIVASNALESYLYIPDDDLLVPLVEYAELQSYVNPAVYTISQAAVASENYFFYFTTLRNVGDSSLFSISLSVQGNGGYRQIGEVTLTSSLPAELGEDYILKKIIADEATGEIYVCGIHNPEGYGYFLYNYDMQ
ncbi:MULTISPECIES: hypothetical protein [unclassified Oceanispirochaeta]|uniref:hypothetical protein n=1 Tax=unclassified Oceanispirochaeta TaxID=2635722 RepID=UPI000E091979|nr:MULTISPECIES: hypothetical protein [unclassified Oceanispirochaeta]MBF9017082.1 hypothetical protein [Oceanispirochaeta sp. M2]NPD73531.1 hypothetical protein [Oceanispirochaeta sp. M1]RDG30819.1 hypothetical protein DV872_15655 [Oceanispirochaeta sp. M1]